MFLVGGVNAITQALPADVQAFAMAGLTAVAAYFHLQTGRGYSPQS